MSSDNLENRILIRERYGAYSDAAFQKDNDLWLSCWTDDGIWMIFGKEIRGKEALLRQWDETWQSIDRMAFFSEIGAMQIREFEADVRSYCHEIVSFKNGKLLKVVSQYSDELRKIDGAWLFAKREYSVLIQE